MTGLVSDTATISWFQHRRTTLELA